MPSSSASSSNDEVASDDEDYLRPYAWSPIALMDAFGILPQVTPPAAAAKTFGKGYSFHNGPPYLRCDVAWGHCLCFAASAQQVEPAWKCLTQEAAAWRRLAAGRYLEVWVDWGHADSTAQDAEDAHNLFTLTARVRGEVVVAQRTAVRGAALRLSLNVSEARAGDEYLVYMSWAGGSRYLHVLAPLRPEELNLRGLLAAPSSICRQRGLAELPTASALLRSLLQPARVEAPHALSRGFGIEIELLTGAVDAAAMRGCLPATEIRGDQTPAERLPHSVSKSSQWRSLIDLAEEELARRGAIAGLRLEGSPNPHDECKESPHEALRHEAGQQASLQASLHALRRDLQLAQKWAVETDSHIMTSPREVAESMVASECGSQCGSHEGRSEEGALSCEPAQWWTEAAKAWLCDVASGGSEYSAHKSEYTSPAPPYDLRFNAGATSQLTCVYRLLRSLGATAPSLSRLWHGGASTHVHVNCTNPEAGGTPLDAIQILNVFFAWVRFDPVTRTMTRPWMWREPSSAPLYATGPEFTWNDHGFAQGHGVGVGSSADYDVPMFLRGVRAVLKEKSDFFALPLPEQLERLFGGHPKGSASSSPGSMLGRHGSLNLRRLTSFGTLEFRRFHGTLDERASIRWAAFCVAFVETFRTHSCEEYIHMPHAGLPSSTNLAEPIGATVDSGLSTLQAAQEHASIDELKGLMAQHIDERLITWLVEDAIHPSREATVAA